MNTIRAARWFGSVAVAVVLAGAATAPAAAVQTESLSIDVYVSDTVVPSSGTSATSLLLTSTQETELENPRFTFDLSGLAGIASLEPDRSGCAEGGGQVVCESAFSEWLPAGRISLFDLVFTADPAATVGDAGVLTTTVEADGVEPTSHESTVTVGAEIDLASDGDLELTAEPGDTLELPLTMRNEGPDSAEGVALQLSWDHTLDVPTAPANCDMSQAGTGMLCTFDATLEPGQTYALATPLEVEIGADTKAPGMVSVFAQWATLAQGEAWRIERENSGAAYAPGSGPELTLVESGGGVPAPVPADPTPAADTNPDNDWSTISITVEGDNLPDFAALGAEFEGDAGETVAIEIGVENLGPATADASRAGEPANWVLVTLPEGTTAVDVPGACSSVVDGVYLCSTEPLLRVGENHLFPFTLQVNEVIADATGLVEVNRSPADPTEGDSFPDADPDNDAAEIVANPTGGTGGGLPVTGMSTALIAAAGALLVALGAVGVFLVRRRRVQFQA